MNTNDDSESPDAVILAHSLEKLRARDGLTGAHLNANRDSLAAPLLGLAAVRRYATVHHVDLTDAAVAVVADCIRETINNSNRIVADAVLGTGVLIDEYRTYGIGKQVLSRLQADSLGTRRDVLLTHWAEFHNALAATDVERPSDRTLRGLTEPSVLRELASQLIRREIFSVGSRNAVTAVSGERARSSAEKNGRVVVVGGAVMDAIYRTTSFPQYETSNEAHDQKDNPGGKGLTQAIAAARLGLNVSLIAAVPEDNDGRTIVEYLRAQDVDISLLKRVPKTRTPQTVVIERDTGDSIAVNWRNEAKVRLDIDDINERADELTSCDVVMLTFEIPRETLQHALAVVHTARDRTPIIIVTPGQPYSGPPVTDRSLAQIHYMVAHAWELDGYSPDNLVGFDPDPAARRLLTVGLRNLCILSNTGCTIYSSEFATFSKPAQPSLYKETQTARDAFCAALAAKLIESGGSFSPGVAHWATMAMSCAAADFPRRPNSLPDRPRIEAMIARSRRDFGYAD